MSAPEARRPVLLCAGGTGGHLFPAEALAGALAARGVPVELATDERAAAFAGSFPAQALHAIPSETVRGRSPMALARTAWKLGSGFVAAWRMLGRVRPAAVVGFGGYPTVPPLLAAVGRGYPTLIHEQNAVMGRANRLLAGRVSAIATGFPAVGLVADAVRPKMVRTGNPLRPAVMALAGARYPSTEAGLTLLVFGGSQGARVMSDIVPDAIECLKPELRARLTIVQQARQEDVGRVEGIYGRLGVASQVAPFFKDLPALIAAAHLVIARSGAGTVSELAVIGRPAILVPLPGSLDQDQAANAKVLAGTGGARVILQPDFTAERLAGDLSAMLADADGLARAAEAALRLGTSDAAERLADEVMRIARF